MTVLDLLALAGISVGISLVVAAAASLVLLAGAAAATRSRARIAEVRKPLRWPVAALAFTVALSVTTGATGLQAAMGGGGPVLAQLLVIAGIAAGAWLLVRLLGVASAAVLGRFAAADAGRRARKVHTQVGILRRVLSVVVVVVAFGAALFTFEAARVAGTSLLASAGLASLVAGLAAQSLLGNVFAGIQLVASDAIRVDDVVVVEGEWGTIEEITLTYVVVRIWDDRRLVLPSTYFTTTPFENWTRTSSEVMGAVELDVDWSVPVERMREELARILDGHPHWDGRDSVLQVTDAVGGVVRVRVLVTAADGSELASLRADVRERLVAWLREGHAEALPRQRFEAVPLVRTEERADA
ncbi:mechanosensitive ion channel family protein [Agrococcus carbonis]|uniref:Mechanosensitive ion channel n=1 Tax=Agrococcus carbonis TaxID=684552 RepID=A0A1H1M3Y5_9MICO|nr:mechanosensitive ion channel domain-containing protein [Agrococcus carbonis]SDR80729.1 Mechanosensitive ion channel [Agrococcus carbonis]